MSRSLPGRVMPRRPPHHLPVKRWQGGATAEGWIRFLVVWGTLETQIERDSLFQPPLKSKVGSKRTRYDISWTDGTRWWMEMDEHPADWERLEHLPLGRFMDDREERQLVTGAFWWYQHRFHGRSFRRLARGLIARAWFAGRHEEGVPVMPDPSDVEAHGEQQEAWGQKTVARWVAQAEAILNVVNLDGPHRYPSRTA